VSPVKEIELRQHQLEMSVKTVVSVEKVETISEFKPESEIVEPVMEVQQEEILAIQEPAQKIAVEV